MRAIYIGILSLWVVSAQAVVLAEIPTAPSDRLPIDTSRPDVPCDQIIDRLTQYNGMARQHDASVAGFLGEVSAKIGEWHAILSPLEGQSNAIPAGTFSPLLRGASEIDNITNLAFDNSDLLAQELDKIIVSLQACGVGAGSPPRK